MSHLNTIEFRNAFHSFLMCVLVGLTCGVLGKFSQDPLLGAFYGVVGALASSAFFALASRKIDPLAFLVPGVAGGLSGAHSNNLLKLISISIITGLLCGILHRLICNKNSRSS